MSASNWNIGKYKVLFQQAFGILNLPIALMTNAAVMIGFFGWEAAALVAIVILFAIITMMFVLAKFMLSQEINYSWSKSDDWQQFRREWNEFRKQNARQ